MNKDSLVNKMAEGFYENAKNHKEVNLCLEDLKFLVWSISKNKDLSDFMNSPFVSNDEKFNSLSNIFKEVINKEVLIFIKMLIDNEIFDKLKDVLDIYTSLSYKDNDILEGVIYTPFELNESQINKIVETFTKINNKKCVFNVSIDQSLIGGVKILLDGYMYEYNVNDMLNEIKKRLIKEGENKNE